WKPGLGAACRKTRPAGFTAPPATWRSTRCGGSEPTPRHCRAWPKTPSGNRRRSKRISPTRSATNRCACSSSAATKRCRPNPVSPSRCGRYAGFSTAEIARALLTSDANVQKRIERARDRLRELDLVFDTPPAAQLRARLDAVLAVVYLLFGQGCHVTHGDLPIRRDLCAEARRLARMLAAQSV